MKQTKHICSLNKHHLILVIITGLLIIGGFLTYWNLPRLVSFMLSKNFGFRVSLEELNFYKQGLEINDLKIFNLKPSNYDPAVSCASINVAASLRQLIQKTLTIDEISLDQINLNIQFYDAAKEQSNFNDIINTETPASHKKENKPYLIKKLLLKNLYVKLIFSNGKEKDVYIEKLEFNNISEKSGFPVAQLEKAILHAVLKSIFKRFNIKNILKPLEPQNLIPNTVPKLIPFF